MDRARTRRDLLLRMLAASAAAAAIAAPASAAAEAASPAERPTRTVVDESPRELRELWTTERLREAQSVAPAGGFEPATAPELSEEQLETLALPRLRPQRFAVAGTDREVGATRRYPARVHGKLFLTIPGVGDASCSGTIVGSNGRNVVYTAGHCVYDRGRDQWATNVVFIPGYRNGATPFGVYAAADLWALAGWTDLSLGLSETEANSFDVGVIVIAGQVQNRVGARGVAFNRPRAQRYSIYGYPSRPSPPYDGERLINCPAAAFRFTEDELPRLPPTADPVSSVAAPCFMQQGSSGGGWVIEGGRVNSVVSHGFCDFIEELCGHIHGPYFGQGARSLYVAAGGGDGKAADSIVCGRAKRKLSRASKRLRKAKRADRKAGGARTAKRLRKAKKQRRKAAKPVRKQGC